MPYADTRYARHAMLKSAAATLFRHDDIFAVSFSFVIAAMPTALFAAARQDAITRHAR